MAEIKDAKMKALQARAEAAQSRYEEDERALYRADGERVYGEAEHEERMNALRAERARSCREVQEEASQIGLAARTEIENAENADPSATLTDAELARANARRPLAIDAAEGLDVGDLKKRLLSVLAAGDRAEIAAYLAAGERRRRQIIEHRSDADAEGAGTPAARAAVSKFTFLDETLEKMREVLSGGGRSATIEAARARQQEAMTVELLAGNLQVGARSAARAHALRNYGPGSRDLRAASPVR